MKECCINDCRRKIFVKKKELCRIHYIEQLNLDACCVKDCEVKVWAKKMCDRHYHRAKKGQELDVPIPEKHYLSKRPEYRTWIAMKARCENPNRKAYKDYGGRGIKVCYGWYDFILFFKDMGIRPGPDYSIDRINNDSNYSCGHCEECLREGWTANCRWATQSQQNMNKRPPKNETGFKGVKIDGNRFTARITFNYKTYYLGSYATAEEAHNAFLKAENQRSLGELK